LPAPTTAPAAAPTTEPTRLFPQTGHTLRGAFLAFWERHDGERTLGPPHSDAVWLDRRAVQFFDRARLEEGGPGTAATEVVRATLPAPWRTTLPGDLLALAASPWRATVRATRRAEPLLPITVTLSIPGYSGPAELRIYDGRMQPAGAWPADVRDGAATLAIE